MAAVVPARRGKQWRQERARPRAHQPDNRCCTGFDEVNPVTESGSALNLRACPHFASNGRKMEGRKMVWRKMAAVVPARRG